MATMNINSSQMRAIASDIKEQMEAWEASVKRIYDLNNELDATWEGAGKAEFNQIMEEDRAKYNSLSLMMQEYQNLILEIAANYDESDAAAKSILSSR